jgi:hypothetical protein
MKADLRKIILETRKKRETALINAKCALNETMGTSFRKNCTEIINGKELQKMGRKEAKRRQIDETFSNLNGEKNDDDYSDTDIEISEENDELELISTDDNDFNLDEVVDELEDEEDIERSITETLTDVDDEEELDVLMDEITAKTRKNMKAAARKRWDKYNRDDQLKMIRAMFARGVGKAVEEEGIQRKRKTKPLLVGGITNKKLKTLLTDAMLDGKESRKYAIGNATQELEYYFDPDFYARSEQPVIGEEIVEVSQTSAITGPKGRAAFRKSIDWKRTERDLETEGIYLEELVKENQKYVLPINKKKIMANPEGGAEYIKKLLYKAGWRKNMNLKEKINQFDASFGENTNDDEEYIDLEITETQEETDNRICETVQHRIHRSADKKKPDYEEVYDDDMSDESWETKKDWEEMEEREAETDEEEHEYTETYDDDDDDEELDLEITEDDDEDWDDDDEELEELVSEMEDDELEDEDEIEERLEQHFGLKRHLEGETDDEDEDDEEPEDDEPESHTDIMERIRKSNRYIAPAKSALHGLSGRVFSGRGSSVKMTDNARKTLQKSSGLITEIINDTTGVRHTVAKIMKKRAGINTDNDTAMQRILQKEKLTDYKPILLQDDEEEIRTTRGTLNAKNKKLLTESATDALNKKYKKNAKL